MIERGVPIRAINLRAGRLLLTRLDLAGLDTAYPFILSLPQADTEAVLAARLAALGVRVEWRHGLSDLVQTADGVSATVEAEGGWTTVRSSWLVGCDGARSLVRERAGLAFEGERYEQAFNLADIDMVWPHAHDEAQLLMSPEGVIFTVPLPGGEHRVRLIVDEALGSANADRPDPTVEDVRQWVTRRTGRSPTSVGDPVWTSRFRIQRRLASDYRSGRLLIAGDAAHVHSPAGAQGMNGGIQDAVNLGWKLALVTTGRAPEALIDTYAAERRPAAEAILAGTDRLTRVATLRGPLRHLRDRLLPLAFGLRAVREHAIHLQTGLHVSYQGSPIVGPSAGSRAPDVVTASGRLYDLAMRHPDHTLLLFLGRPADEARRRDLLALAASVKRRWGVCVRTCLVGEAVLSGVGIDCVVPDSDESIHSAYDLERGGICLVRPDRYVVCTASSSALGIVERGLERVLRADAAGVRP